MGGHEAIITHLDFEMNTRRSKRRSAGNSNGNEAWPKKAREAASPGDGLVQSWFGKAEPGETAPTAPGSATKQGLHLSAKQEKSTRVGDNYQVDAAILEQPPKQKPPPPTGRSSNGVRGLLATRRPHRPVGVGPVACRAIGSREGCLGSTNVSRHARRAHPASGSLRGRAPRVRCAPLSTAGPAVQLQSSRQPAFRRHLGTGISSFRTQGGERSGLSDRATRGRRATTDGELRRHTRRLSRPRRWSSDRWLWPPRFLT